MITDKFRMDFTHEGLFWVVWVRISHIMGYSDIMGNRCIYKISNLQTVFVCSTTIASSAGYDPHKHIKIIIVNSIGGERKSTLSKTIR